MYQVRLEAANLTLHQAISPRRKDIPPSPPDPFASKDLAHRDTGDPIASLYCWLPRMDAQHSALKAPTAHSQTRVIGSDLCSPCAIGGEEIGDMQNSHTSKPFLGWSQQQKRRNKAAT
jgi:hypothetical protein